MKTSSILKLPSLASPRWGAAVLAAGCALFSGGLALAQPTISSIYPDGSVQFQWTNKLTFVTGGAAAVTNISVTFDCKPMGGTENIQIYNSAAGLTINGNNVSAPLQSNVVYSATIIVTDSTGASATSTVSFDTIRPSYTWEAEDWDFDSGQFIDNPQLNAYAGKVAVPEVDGHVDYTGGVGTAYRPAGGAVVSTNANLGNEVNGDIPRTQYLTSGQSDYDVGWNDNGNWGNYTRHYPAGKWNVFMRGAGNSASHAELYQGGVLGTFLGDFNVPASGGYQSYTWVPLTGSDGNPVEWDTDGTQQTLTGYTVSSGYNINFYLLLPVRPPVTQDATISGFFPDGTVQFQTTNLFSFTINSSLGVQASKILVTLSGTNLAGKATSSILQAGSGLTISGSATALLVTFPLATNTVYKAILQATDANGFLVSQAVAFDTINPSYTWEAEDYDYGGGQFFDNPQINAYATLQATFGVDGYNPNNGSAIYRPVVATGPDGDLGNEQNSDTPRIQYLNSGQTDYDTGWTTPTSPPPLGKLHPALSRWKMEHLSASRGERRVKPDLAERLAVPGRDQRQSAGPIRCPQRGCLADLYLGASDRCRWKPHRMGHGRQPNEPDDRVCRRQLQRQLLHARAGGPELQTAALCQPDYPGRQREYVRLCQRLELHGQFRARDYQRQHRGDAEWIQCLPPDL
jgi:hypothetical protein